MVPGDIGISQATINKHLTWIAAVLAHAAGEEDDEEGYRPQKPLSFKAARAVSARGLANSASATATSAPTGRNRSSQCCYPRRSGPARRASTIG